MNFFKNEKQSLKRQIRWCINGPAPLHPSPSADGYSRHSRAHSRALWLCDSLTHCYFAVPTPPWFSWAGRCLADVVSHRLTTGSDDWVGNDICLYDARLFLFFFSGPKKARKDACMRWFKWDANAQTVMHLHVQLIFSMWQGGDWWILKHNCLLPAPDLIKNLVHSLRYHS